MNGPKDDKPRQIDDLDLNERLHVDIGTTCNNNCLFCMEEDRQGRTQRVGRLTPKDIFGILDRNVGRREVVFVSGEPTLNPHFIEYVRHASDVGYQRVGVISNGRRFAYLPFVNDAVHAGLNHVILSIHGPNSAVHDGLTRTPKAFEQAMAGLRNLAAFRSQGMRLDTSTVLNRRNCDKVILEEHLVLLRPLVDQMVFNVIQPFGRGQTYFNSLVLRYTEVAQTLGEFFARHVNEELPIFLVDIPYCTTEGCGIPDRARGYVERYCHFEVSSGQEGRPSAASLRADSVEGLVEGGAEVKRGVTLPTHATSPDSETPPNLVARHRDAQERTQKVKFPPCLSCAYNGICDGVWANYVDHYGFDEFVPVRKS